MSQQLLNVLSSRGTICLRSDLSCRKSSDYELDRTPVDTTSASFTSFNSEEGFGSPAARRSKGRPNVFDMDDNDLKVTCLLQTCLCCNMP